MSQKAKKSHFSLKKPEICCQFISKLSIKILMFHKTHELLLTVRYSANLNWFILKKKVRQNSYTRHRNPKPIATTTCLLPGNSACSRDLYKHRDPATTVRNLSCNCTSHWNRFCPALTILPLRCESTRKCSQQAFRFFLLFPWIAFLEHCIHFFLNSVITMVFLPLISLLGVLQVNNDGKIRCKILSYDQKSLKSETHVL